MREICPTGPIDATLTAPGSKSFTNRGLILGALAGGETVLRRALRCDDTVSLAAALRTLGILVTEEGDDLRIAGLDGRLPGAGARLDAGASGTALRFLTALAALASEETVIDGTPDLRLRPVEPICAALRSLGAEAHASEIGGAPVRVRRAGLAGGRVEVDGGLSSQFLSALLMIGPYLPEGLRVTVAGRLVSAPYVEVTLDVMEAFGLSVERSAPGEFTVRSGRYEAREYPIEGDWSAAGYFLAAAAVTGGRVRVENLRDRTVQADQALLGILAEMGCTVKLGEGYAEVAGGALTAVEVDLRDAPDLAPTVAAVATAAEGTTVIRGSSHLKHKESDRIAATVAAVRALGGQAEPREDGLIVEGGGIGPGDVDPRGDHRIAMAFSLPGLVRPGVRILDPGCVAKSYPDFFEDLERL